MFNDYLTIGEVAARLGVQFYRIKYAHQAGHVEEPLRVGNHRLYAEDDIRRLQLYFATKEEGDDGSIRVQGQELLGVAQPEGLRLHHGEREGLRQGVFAAQAGMGAGERPRPDGA